MFGEVTVRVQHLLGISALITALPHRENCSCLPFLGSSTASGCTCASALCICDTGTMSLMLKLVAEHKSCYKVVKQTFRL